MAGASSAFRLPRPELFGYMRRRSWVRFPLGVRIPSIHAIAAGYGRVGPSTLGPKNRGFFVVSRYVLAPRGHIIEGYIVRLSRGRKYLRRYLFCLYSVVVRHAFSLWKGEGKPNLYFNRKDLLSSIYLIDLYIGLLPR